MAMKEKTDKEKFFANITTGQNFVWYFTAVDNEDDNEF